MSWAETRGKVKIEHSSLAGVGWAPAVSGVERGGDVSMPNHVTPHPGKVFN